MTTIRTHLLGFPRIGAQRELKFALEQYWRGEISAAALAQVGQQLRAQHWALQQQAGLDWVSVGDFAWYDHVANHIQLLGCEPKRFGFGAQDTALDRYFTMARGVRPAGGEAHADCCGVGGAGGVPALEMTKWFDSNYHYLVPELDPETHFALSHCGLFEQVAEAQALGHQVKPVLLGPLSFLWLSKSKTEGFDRLSLLEQLLPVYAEILARLRAQGVTWVQLDEPILGLDLPLDWQMAFERAYWQLNQSQVSLLLSVYFSPLGNNLGLACRLPVAGLHVDGVRGADELGRIADWLAPFKVLSVGIVDGRNIWRTDLDAALSRLQALLDKGRELVWLAPSCSLLHVPLSLRAESRLPEPVKSWLAFAEEKLTELQVLKLALQQPPQAEPALAQARVLQTQRRNSTEVHQAQVQQRLQTLQASDFCRRSGFALRQRQQQQRWALPLFPTTTIGSFPQTAAIRRARAEFKQGLCSAQDYEQRMQEHIRTTVQLQEQWGLDVLVHGEAERNDMVEYFAEFLQGYVVTELGWVQSYGSRCVKPPILYGDVVRTRPITVDWTRFAQSLSSRPVKGMLTGPITMLQWSFVRDDQARALTAQQLALAIRDEVQALEQAGIGIIQIDEPALREGLPLREAERPAYLDWATAAFRLAASGVADATQIHSHMCYCEFNDILPQIAALDADVITLETSRSDMELLQGFADFAYPNAIGPGVYDIHSPHVPSVDDMVRLLDKASAVIPVQQLWVNPDCGLKTRDWPETEAALRQMVRAAQVLRQRWAQSSATALASHDTAVVSL